MHTPDTTPSNELLSGLNHDELLMHEAPPVDRQGALFAAESLAGEEHPSLKDMVQNFDYRGAKDKVGDLIRTHPFQALGLGVGLGMLLARRRK